MALTTGSKELREAIENLETVLEDGTQADDVTLEIVEGVMNVKDDGIDSDQIAAGAIDLAHMSANSIDSDQYVDGSIDTAHFAAGSVNAAALGTAAVTGAKIHAAALAVLASAGVDATGGAAPVTVTGAGLGDKVTAVVNLTDNTVVTSSFAATTTANALSQLSGNHDTDVLLVFLIKA
jgi:hypothetical protein